MPVFDIPEGGSSKIVTAARKKTNLTAFPKILSNALPREERELSSPKDLKNSEPRNTGQPPVIELGRISKETPTVSHILINHPEYSDKCWDIIFSSENQGKPFTKMPEGTVVAIKPGSNELVWGRELSMTTKRVDAESSKNAINVAQKKGHTDKTMVIGTISRDKPTVSHLFQANAHFDNSFWDIIHAPINSNKNYSSLRPGTEVVLDTKTMELSFINTSPKRSDRQTAKITRPEQHANGEKIQHDSLAQAVKPFIGTPYNKIDCYGLVVRGLMNQGIQYTGHGGLREKLEDLATRNGLPNNAYFSGEGLVEKAGKRIFSKSMYKISNTQEKTDEIYAEIIPYLREGLILSFSTPTRGHTGIVSRQGDDWTYINSGVIDNQVSPSSIPKGVGEELLRAEINNWCVLAAERKEPLTVTIGHLDAKLLQDSDGPEERS